MLVDVVGIEPTRPKATGLQPARTPLFHHIHKTWYCVRVSSPSSHLERVMTSPEVERSIFGGPTGDRTPTYAVQTHCAPIITISPNLSKAHLPELNW
jgi:hypothetical protein